jgi:RNA polymerase sigma-70 factor (ECF subfamily)
MSEAEAIEGAKQGNGECFEFLYNSHKRHVYSLCFSMLGTIEAAEDFTQEAFLQLYRKIGSFRGDSAFSTWLHRVTVNVVLMRLRKKVLSEVSLDETLDINDEGVPRGTLVARTGISLAPLTAWS